jgi:hypothetical protein
LAELACGTLDVARRLAFEALEPRFELDGQGLRRHGAVHDPAHTATRIEPLRQLLGQVATICQRGHGLPHAAQLKAELRYAVHQAFDVLERSGADPHRLFDERGGSDVLARAFVGGNGQRWRGKIGDAAGDIVYQRQQPFDGSARDGLVRLAQRHQHVFEPMGGGRNLRLLDHPCRTLERVRQPQQACNDGDLSLVVPLQREQRAL